MNLARLGRALKHIRQISETRQETLAEDLGISRSYLSEIESEKKIATLGLINKYAEYLGIKTSNLIYLIETYEESARKYIEIDMDYKESSVSMIKWSKREKSNDNS